MKRLDQWMVELKLVPSRTKAKELLESGVVRLRVDHSWMEAPQGSRKFKELSAEDFEITENQLLKYVARSGLKLDGAIKKSGIQVVGLNCLDVGQSTGGFTDCLLQLGAKKIVGFDVGHDQLAEKIKGHPNVISIEGLNAKDIEEHPDFNSSKLQFDLVVIDVSFISIIKVIPYVLPFLKEQGDILALIKPQFELGAAALNKKGVVRDESELKELKQKMLQHFEELGLKQLECIESQLAGKDGNQEFFIHAKK